MKGKKSATCAVKYTLGRAVWGHIWKCTAEKSQISAINVIMPPLMEFHKTFDNTQWRKVEHMQPVWLCLLWSRRFEETFDNAQWRILTASMSSPLSAIFSSWRVPITAGLLCHYIFVFTVNRALTQGQWYTKSKSLWTQCFQICFDFNKNLSNLLI